LGVFPPALASAAVLARLQLVPQELAPALMPPQAPVRPVASGSPEQAGAACRPEPKSAFATE
jgi:hypothetical protein